MHAVGTQVRHQRTGARRIARIGVALSLRVIEGRAEHAYIGFRRFVGDSHHADPSAVLEGEGGRGFARADRGHARQGGANLRYAGVFGAAHHDHILASERRACQFDDFRYGARLHSGGVDPLGLVGNAAAFHAQAGVGLLEQGAVRVQQRFIRRGKDAYRAYIEHGGPFQARFFRIDGIVACGFARPVVLRTVLGRGRNGIAPTYLHIAKKESCDRSRKPL